MAFPDVVYSFPELNRSKGFWKSKDLFRNRRRLALRIHAFQIDRVSSKRFGRRLLDDVALDANSMESVAERFGFVGKDASNKEHCFIALRLPISLVGVLFTTISIALFLCTPEFRKKLATFKTNAYSWTHPLRFFSVQNSILPGLRPRKKNCLRSINISFAKKGTIRPRSNASQHISLNIKRFFSNVTSNLIVIFRVWRRVLIHRSERLP